MPILGVVASSISGHLLPGAPTINNPVIVTNATTVSIPFTAGTGSGITSYVATSSPSISLSVTGTTTPLTVTGAFAAGTAYSFQIAAVNSVGTGAYSTASTPTVTPVTGAFNLIQQLTPSGVSSVTFSSIPSTYKSLHVRFNALASGTATPFITFNGDTATNYACHSITGYNSSLIVSAGLASSTSIQRAWAYMGMSSTYPNVMTLDVVDYSSTSKNKTIKNFYGVSTGAASAEVGIASGVWLSTAAVNSLTISLGAFTYLSGSTISLYGVN